MRKPRPVKILVGEDGEPRGMVVGYRVGPLRTLGKTLRVVQYVPVVKPSRAKTKRTP